MFDVIEHYLPKDKPGTYLNYQLNEQYYKRWGQCKYCLVILTGTWIKAVLFSCIISPEMQVILHSSFSPNHFDGLSLTNSILASYKNAIEAIVSFGERDLVPIIILCVQVTTWQLKDVFWIAMFVDDMTYNLLLTSKTSHSFWPISSNRLDSGSILLYPG